MTNQFHRLSAGEDPPHSAGLRPSAPNGLPERAADLAYKIEVWGAGGAFPERCVAATSTASLGYAVFYAASREYLGQEITLSHRGSVLSRWAPRPRG